jgi:TPR repeat protein
LYQYGYGIRKIASRAIEFYKLAAEQGNVDAAYNLWYIYHQHYDWKWNYREAFKWYSIAANGGSICAQNGLALLYLKGLGTDINYQKAIHWYTEAARSRNINTMVSLASIYRKGDIVGQDYTKVLEWYKKAIKEESTVAQNSLESFYNNKSISATDSRPKIDSKISLCSKLHSDISNIPESGDLVNLKTLASYCERGDGHAMLNIGKRYSQGNVFPQDKYIAFKWIKNTAKAGLNEARLGSLDAQLKLAKIYGEIEKQQYNTGMSFKYYQMAADQGSTYAKYKVALMYLDGQGTRQDVTQAYRLLKKCSDLGYANAINIFSTLIDSSTNLDIDYRKLAAMFVTVCNEEIDSLEFNIGYIYSHDVIFIYDYSLLPFAADSFLERTWYERAAKKGNPMALYELGIFYENMNEKSETKDLSKSIDYFQRAHTSGSIDATYKLATIYLHGHGVSQDFRKAFTLLNKSADMGHKEAHQILNSFNYDNGKDNYEAIKKMLEISAESGQVLS